jgi:hypothetical protein
MELHDRPGTDAESSETARAENAPSELPPADFFDPDIEAYKKDIDRTLLRANLRLSVAERLARFQSFMDSVEEMRGAALPSDVRERLFGKR